jgi:hypothetical protein
MNVWAINKDLAIKHFLLELVQLYGENSFSCSPDQDHFQAIEIYPSDTPFLSAYIYTFAQPEQRYAVDLKFPLPENNIIGGNENLTWEQLISILQTHFDL